MSKTLGGNIIDKVGFYDVTVVPNEIVRDKRLSAKAKGIYVTLIMCEKGWRFSKKWLQAMSTDCESSIRSGINELESLNYLWIEKLAGVGKYEWHIYRDPKDCEFDKSKNSQKYEDIEESIEDIETDEIQEVESNTWKSSIENQEHINTNSISTNDINSKSKDLESSQELSLEEEFNKDKNKKDFKTLFKWTKILVTDNNLIDELENFLLAGFANNKWQTLGTYRRKLEMLMTSCKSIDDAIAVVRDTVDSNYFTFKYSIDRLNKSTYTKAVKSSVNLVRAADEDFGQLCEEEY